MSKVQSLRVAANTEAPRSPARTALAEALERKCEHTERLAVTEATLTDLRLAPLEEKVEAATAAVEQAKRDAVQHFVDTKLDRGGPVPMNVKDARAAQRDAEDELEAAQNARALLKQEVSKVRGQIEYIQLGRLIGEVIRTDPACAALLARFAEKSRELENIGRAVEAIQLHLTGEQKSLVSRNDTGERSMANAWRAAIAALEIDPDAPLPSEV